MKPKIKPRREQRYRKQEILLAVGSFFIIAVLAAFFILSPHITLKGKTTERINIHSAYQDPGYRATYLGKDVSKQVKIKGKVDSEKLGTYEITYTLKQGLFTTKVKRTVKVEDLEAPVITLQGEKDFLMCPHQDYQELGFQAIDNVDGDVTSQVKVTKKDNTVTYEVKDKAGNKATVKRNLTEGDREKPTITLNGDAVTFIYLNETYQEPGYQAIDNCDGDITGNVKVSGTVNSSVYGENTLVYTVEDQHHNVEEVKRIVKVVQPGGPGTIYLTFDDGPRAGTTDQILDILKETGVKATFFVTGSGPDELIKRAASEGHSIGLHTASHQYGVIYASGDAYFADLQAVHDRVQRITGIDSRIIRFPGGSSNTVSRKYKEGIMTYLTREVLLRGYQYYDWNITSGDSGELTDSEAIANQVISKLSLEKVNMVLMHDTKTYTKDALRKIIDYGKANGYKFEAITLQTEMIRQKVNN